MTPGYSKCLLLLDGRQVSADGLYHGYAGAEMGEFVLLRSELEGGPDEKSLEIHSGDLATWVGIRWVKGTDPQLTCMEIHFLEVTTYDQTDPNRFKATFDFHRDCDSDLQVLFGPQQIEDWLEPHGY